MAFFFSIVAILFPFFVAYIMYKRRKIEEEDPAIEAYDRKYEALYEDFKTSDPFYVQYYFVFILRRVTYALLAYFMWQPEYTIIQLHLNQTISFMFLIYLVTYKPFLDPFLDKVEVFNEISYMVITYHQLGFTDITTEVHTKHIIGWSMIGFCLLSFGFNMVLMIKNLYYQVKLERI